MRTFISAIAALTCLACYTSHQHNAELLDDQRLSPEDSLRLERELSEVGVFDSLFMIDTRTYSSLDSIPQEFFDYYDRFLSDSAFQIEHVRFPLKGVGGDCEDSKLWERSDWEVIQWDLREYFYNPMYNNTIAWNEHKVFFIFYKIEIGVVAELGFEKQDGEWLLVYYFSDGC